jgi:hypothetical protein
VPLRRATAPDHFRRAFLSYQGTCSRPWRRRRRRRVRGDEHDGRGRGGLRIGRHYKRKTDPCLTRAQRSDSLHRWHLERLRSPRKAMALSQNDKDHRQDLHPSPSMTKATWLCQAGLAPSCSSDLAPPHGSGAGCRTQSSGEAATACRRLLDGSSPRPRARWRRRQGRRLARASRSPACRRQNQSAAATSSWGLSSPFEGRCHVLARPERAHHT